MKIITLPKIIIVVLILLIGCRSKDNPSTQKSLQVFLVRHAEKIDHSLDPNLSDEGSKRSLLLAQVLKNAGIEYVHSSDFIRTRDTATPIADAQELEVELYDPENLSILVEKLRRTGGRHLVVGHSGSTPSMVELLGGNPGVGINEEREFDRLYIVTVAKDKSVNSVMLRYGNIYNPKLN